MRVLLDAPGRWGKIFERQGMKGQKRKHCKNQGTVRKLRVGAGREQIRHAGWDTVPLTLAAMPFSLKS